MQFPFKLFPSTNRVVFSSAESISMKAFTLHEGAMYCEKTPISRIASEFGTPAYVNSKAAIEANFLAYSNVVSGPDERRSTLTRRFRNCAGETTSRRVMEVNHFGRSVITRNNLVRFVFVLFTCLGFCCIAQADTRFNFETAARIDALVASKVPWSGDTPAYTILIDQGGEIVYERNIGFADISNKVPTTRDTVYKIGSITKSYTALAILQLVEKGQLDLDANVTDYLPDYVGPAGMATIRELLTHTSGIPNYTALPEAGPVLSSSVVTREEVVGLFAGKPLEFEPGSAFSYSNSGYYLLGLIVEAVSAQDYFSYLKENIFGPLGLKATFVGEFEEIVPHQARGYTVTPEGYANAALTPQLAPFSAGILEASAADLVKYRRAVFHSGAISDALREMLTSVGSFSGGIQQRYALGSLTLSDFSGHRRWGHSGGISGFSSHYDYFPDEDITIVVLVNTNGEPISPRNLATKIAREMFTIPQPSEMGFEVSEEQLKSYTGKYQMNPFRLIGEYVRIVVKKGVLQLQVNDDDENPILIPLLARSDNEFVLAVDDELRFRFTSESGRVTGLEIHAADGVSPGVLSSVL